MSTEAEFIKGLLVKAPKDGAPDYVIARLSIKREELIEWLQSREGEWINADVKESRGGKWYCAVDNWKPKERQESTPRQQAQRPQREQPASGGGSFQDDSDIPFSPLSKRTHW